MADQMLYVTWGAPVHGREERALEVFNETLGMAGRMQQDGRIESFAVALFHPSGDLGGYLQMNGSAQQIAALATDEEFLRNTSDAQLIVEHLRHIRGVTNEGVARFIDMYREAVGKVPQMS